MHAHQTPDLGKVRTGRSSLAHLARAIENRALTEDDAKRWIKRMQAAFDEVLGAPPPPAAPQPGPFTVIRGDRP